MKVIKSEEDYVEFNNGLKVIGYGDEDCCAHNYLDFEQLPLGTELPDLNAKQFKDYINIKEDGFSLKDSDGTPKWVQARSEQNGYYSNMTTLFVEMGDTKIEISRLSGEGDW